MSCDPSVLQFNINFVVQCLNVVKVYDSSIIIANTCGLLMNFQK
jgi:hypothetical protein